MKKLATKPQTPKAVPKQSQRGKWVYKPLVSVVLTCKCGNKYVATRKGQKTCLRCMFDK